MLQCRSADGYAFLVAAVLVVSTAALAEPAAGQDLAVGVRSAPLSIDPQYNSNGPDTSAARNVFDALLRRSPTFKLLPNLATEWHQVRDDLWEFKLRDGVKWQDGRPFTATDVVFSINRVPQAKDSTGGFVPYVRAINHTIIIDDHTVRFVTNGPELMLPAELEQVFMVSEHAVTEAGPAGFETGAAAVGTGPYRLASWIPGTAERLQRWDGYWGARPYWKNASFNEISSDAARVAALLSAQVDLINYVPPADVASLEANRKIGAFMGPSIFVYILQLDGRDTSPLVWDAEGKPLPKNPFRDPRVRQAISMAINREAIADITMEGVATPARDLVPLNFPGGEPDAPPLPYNVTAARTLMAEAGYSAGFNVRLTCTNNRLPNDGEVCAVLAPMLERIGIRAEVAALPQAVYFAEFSRGSYSLSMNGLGMTTGDAGEMLSSIAFTRDLEPDLGLYNRARYSNPEIDRITKAMLAASNSEYRLRLLRQGMALLLSDHGYIPIVNLSTVWAADRDKLRYIPQMNEDTLAVAALPADR
jgi:peptide/nickel transport system substrate-binding protein